MFYPVNLDVTERLVLVVGGGEVAWRKVAGLLQAQAMVRVVSPQVSPELSRLAQVGRIEWLPRPFDEEDVEGCWLVVAATDEPQVNRQVKETADLAGVWCNVVDQPELCSFILPAVLRRGELLLTVSTGGASPLLAARIRDQLADLFDQYWANYLDLLKVIRQAVLARGERPEANRKVFEAVLDADLLTPLRGADRQEIDRRLAQAAGLSLAQMEGRGA